ncbi:MAG: hypothetical protein ACI9J3_001597 [Parvicellaceae bacterium]|jgi:hypothetical protein
MDPNLQLHKNQILESLRKLQSPENGKSFWVFAGLVILLLALLLGSSYLKFSPVMRLVTGNVGYHHIHHLNAKIPFYKLHKAAKLTDEYFTPKPIYFSKIMECIRCKVWDEKQKKLIPWSELK